MDLATSTLARALVHMMCKRLMLMRIAKSAIFACFLITSGCATVFKGSTSEVVVRGVHEKDKVFTQDGIPVEHDGPRLKLRANEAPRGLVIKSWATRRQQTIAVSKFAGAGWVVADVLFGIVPLIVDAATGNWNEFDDMSLPEEEEARAARSDKFTR